MSEYVGFVIEGADFRGEGVEVVETAVAAVGRHTCHVAHGVFKKAGDFCCPRLSLIG